MLFIIIIIMDQSTNKPIVKQHGYDYDKAVNDVNDNREEFAEILELRRSSVLIDEDVESEMMYHCGWWMLKPEWLQKLRSPKLILLVFSINFILQSMAANGILPSIISSLERQFRLSSTDVGFIVSSFDIAMVCCIIPVTYLGSRGSRPRWLGWGCIFCGIGCFIFSLPHFASQVYQPASTNSSTDICTEFGTCRDRPDAEGTTLFYLFILGQVCQGVGAAPMFALGISYLDESLDPTTSPIYIGILMSMSLVGTAIGFAGGGQLLNLYTEFDRMDITSLAIHPGDPTWVGAWWPGYLVCAPLLIIDGILIMGFPRKMPGAAIYRLERNRQLQRQSSKAASRRRSTWQRYFVTIFTNSYFLLLAIVACFEGMIVVGFGSFLAKYVEYSFDLTTASAGIYTGLCLVFGGGLGMTLGGFLVKSLDLTCRRVIKFSAGVLCIWLLPFMAFLWHCPVSSIAGVNIPSYNDSSTISISNDCNVGCHCDRGYTPVCDTNYNIQYLSACHAGCSKKKKVPTATLR